MDAQVCKQISRMCRQRAEGFSTNVQGFHPQEYADKLIAIMNGSRDENGVAIIPQPNWVQLGKGLLFYSKGHLIDLILPTFPGQATKTLFARGPSLHYINGALAETKVEKKGQAVKQKRVVRLFLKIYGSFRIYNRNIFCQMMLYRFKKTTLFKLRNQRN